jgi:hypothetical protein
MRNNGDMDVGGRESHGLRITSEEDEAWLGIALHVLPWTLLSLVDLTFPKFVHTLERWLNINP